MLSHHTSQPEDEPINLDEHVGRLEEGLNDVLHVNGESFTAVSSLPPSECLQLQGLEVMHMADSACPCVGEMTNSTTKEALDVDDENAEEERDDLVVGSRGVWEVIPSDCWRWSFRHLPFDMVARTGAFTRPVPETPRLMRTCIRELRAGLSLPPRLLCEPDPLASLSSLPPDVSPAAVGAVNQLVRLFQSLYDIRTFTETEVRADLRAKGLQLEGIDPLEILDELVESGWTRRVTGGYRNR